MNPLSELGKGFRTLFNRVGHRAGVPVLRQDSEVDCGPACLSMILAFHGRDTPIAEVAEHCRTGRGGSNAADLAKAARSYGMRVDSYSLGLDKLGDLPCPSILHWGFKHFVVLERFEGGSATIVDPARGRLRAPRDEVSKHFTGVALAVSPGARFDREGGDDEEPAWRMIGRRALRAPGVKPLLRQVLLTSLFLQAVALSGPLLMKVVVDTILPLESTSLLNVIGLAMGVVLLSHLAASVLRGLVLVTLQAKLDAQVMVSFVEHVLALPYRYFQQRSTGDLLNRLASNTQIRNLLSNQVIGAMLDGAFVVVYGVILLIASPVFGVVVIALGAVQAGLIILTQTRMTIRVKEELAAQASSQSFLVEALTGIESVKAAGVEDRALTRWTGLLADQLEATMRRSRLSTILSVLTTSIQASASMLLLWVGALLVIRGSLTLGEALALISLAQLFLTPVSTLVGAGLQIQQVGGHLQRIATVLRTRPEQSLDRVSGAPVLHGAIELDRVSFQYESGGAWAVHDLSLTIEPGQRVALVGRSGSGKSTVAKLILGLYPPTQGVVRLDGLDLQTLDLRTVRAQCGAVMQDPAVFSGSVRRNISYHDPSLSLESIELAARIAELHADIEAMPLGFETPIAEGGSALSGGQRQRLAIARALAHDPAILVLDEATSALDTETESKVAANLSSTQPCTTIIVAHRLSTVRDADVIVVMDQGAPVERGSHAELMAMGGLYAALVRDQIGNREEPRERA